MGRLGLRQRRAWGERERPDTVSTNGEAPFIEHTNQTHPTVLWDSRREQPFAGSRGPMESRELVGLGCWGQLAFLIWALAIEVCSDSKTSE